MDAAQAISLVLERIRSRGLDYPTADLTADPFQGGWCVYAPVMIADGEPGEGPQARSVFLVGESGRVDEVSSDEPVEEARRWFEEACIWFGAAEPGAAPHSDLPSHPDLGGSSRPRSAAGYDREAIAAFARALAHETDFAGWLGDRLSELADLLGGGSRLIARRPNAWGADQVRELAEPNADRDGRPGVWQTWPAIDPANLPDTEATGWLLVPCVTACGYVEDLESETDAATRVADAIADRAEQAPSWRACGVAEMMPQLIALRRTDRLDADLGTLRDFLAEHDAADVLDGLLVAPSPGDDVEALLRLAIDADRRHSDVVDLDAAATAAYRRVLDRLDLPFENYAFEAMFE